MKNYAPYHLQRQKWYLQVDKYHYSVKEICRIFGISRKTYYKWRKRDFGPRKSYQSKNQPNLKLIPEVKIFIEREKLKTNYGPLKMKYLVKREFNLNLSTTLIYRFYQRKNLIRNKQKKLPWYQPIKERIFALKPGQNVELDVQYIWQKGLFIYRYRLVDEYTRMQFFSDHINKDSQSAIKSLEKAKKYFPFPIQSIQTDNGAEFRGELHEYLKQQNIAHHFIPKASAPWDGKVERAHGVMNQEYGHNPNRIFQEPEQYLEWYNFKRIHLGINGLTPYEKYLESVTP